MSRNNREGAIAQSEKRVPPNDTPVKQIQTAFRHVRDASLSILAAERALQSDSYEWGYDAARLVSMLALVKASAKAIERKIGETP